jgi:hypothetical protein
MSEVDRRRGRDRVTPMSAMTERTTPSLPAPELGRRPSRLWSVLLGVLATLAVVAGSVVASASAFVHAELLHPRLYTDALTENRVYRRIYTEVLTDPAVRDAATQLLGDLELPPEAQTDVTAVSNAFLRLVLPPAMLRSLTEEVADDVLRYLRGDVDQLDVRVSLLAALSRIDETASVVLGTVLTQAAILVLEDPAQFERAVRGFAAQLAGGRVPGAIPVLEETAGTDDEVIRTIHAATSEGLPSAMRGQVRGDVVAGDQRDALVTASAAFLEPHLRALADGLVADGDLQVDLIDLLAESSGQDRAQVVARFDAIRDVVARAPAIALPVGVTVATIGALGLLWLGRRRRVSAVLALTGAMVASGAAILVGWAILRTQVGHPLETAMPRDVSLPEPIAEIVHDVDRSLTSNLDASVARPAIVLLVLAGVTALLSVVVALSGRPTVEGRRGHGIDVALAVALLAGGLAIPRAGGAPPPTRECNGWEDLCDRRYDDVVQAAAHNSMSSPDVVRIWPQHDGDVEAQLAFGVRTLMLDTAYWTSIDVTAEAQVLERWVPREMVNAVLRTVRPALEGRPGTFVCHSSCAYGAVPLTQVLEVIRHFLDQNPNEVVTLILQDEIATLDSVTAFVEAGLDRLVYVGAPGDEWPTLGELIDSGQRLVVFSEQHGPPPSWYRNAFATMQDTPLDARTPDDLSCRPNRGPIDAPLFLLNHWIQRKAPDRADAVTINSKQFILERVRRCEQLGRPRANFIAVDFFSLGDVLGAVDELNGVGD